MKCIADKRVIIPFLLFVLTILVSCIPATTAEPTWQPASPTPTFIETGPVQTFTSTASPTVSETGQPTQTFTATISTAASLTGQLTQLITPSPTHCPRPTQEPFSVNPVTSPTDQLSQVITVHIGNGEQVTIITESGTFTVTGNTSSVEITLLPNTVHHLQVIAKVRKVLHSNGCMYGGYTMRTTRDSQGHPLTIIQGEPILREAKSSITVDNARHLEELTSFAPNARLVTDFVFSKDNEVISVGYDSNISVWSTETGKRGSSTGQYAGRCFDGHGEFRRFNHRYRWHG